MFVHISVLSSAFVTHLVHTEVSFPLSSLLPPNRFANQTYVMWGWLTLVLIHKPDLNADVGTAWVFSFSCWCFLAWCSEFLAFLMFRNELLLYSAVSRQSYRSLLLFLKGCLICAVCVSHLCHLPFTFHVPRDGKWEWKGVEKKTEFKDTHNWTFQMVKLLALGKCVEFC